VNAKRRSGREDLAHYLAIKWCMLTSERVTHIPPLWLPGSLGKVPASTGISPVRQVK
jgi:hypothetical protein